MKYHKLFEPLRLGKLELCNRVVMPPMTTGYAHDGFVTDIMIDYYAARASGGAGLVIVEDCIVDTPRGKHGYNDIFIDDDKFIPDLSRLAQAIKDNGAGAAIQLNFSGRMAGKLRNGQLLLTDGQLPVAPSAIAYPFTGFVVPRELTVSEIEAIEDRFAEAARRAQEAGFDMISLHCSHQFLIEQFLSPLSNKRQDAYGGSPDRRRRFVLEIIRKVKQKTGEGFPIMCRVSGKEVAEGGLTIEDARQIARSLEKAGVICLSVSHGASPSGMSPRSVAPLTAATKRSSRGELVPLAVPIKKAVSIPVMTVGSIITPQLAEEILEQGKADLVCIGKGLIADPEWPRKAQGDREREIRHCILKPGLPGINNDKVVTAWQVLRGDMPRGKKVVVIGGGSTGAETAVILAVNRNTVMVVERLSEIAGDTANLPFYHIALLRTLEHLGVSLFVEATAEEITERGVMVTTRGQRLCIKADTVVIALGTEPNRKLADQIEKTDIELYTVGDCATVDNLPRAVKEGFHAGLAL